MSNKPFTAFVVSETHWDRAWYLPFQVYRIRLVRLIDRLISLLDENPAFHSFMLDGQMVPVEDYLEIRPERQADLKRLIKAGRITVGPWYALADEYLVSPESLVRNLLLGMRLADEMGGVMCEGYVPDSFGHIAQLPQILSGFDIQSAIFWRGFGDEGERLGNEFWWQAGGNSQVLTVHLWDGYHNLANLGYHNRGADTTAMLLNRNLALEQLQKGVDLLKPGAQTPYLLLLNGVDHAEPDPTLPDLLAMGNDHLSDAHLQHDTLPAYIAAIRENLTETGKMLPTFSGEFNRGRYAHVLQSVYSTRIYLKQANEQVQTLLECYAEPLSTWAWVLGEMYPGAFLWTAWRTLLKNHPHDDICGCSTDEVHREDMTRFQEATQIGNTLSRDSFRAMMAHIDCTAQAGVPFIFFNPAGWSRTETTTVDLNFNQNNDVGPDFHLVDAAGEHIPHQILNQAQTFSLEVRKPKFREKIQVALPLTNFPACGYRVYYALPGSAPDTLKQPVTTLQQHPNGMENDYLRLTIESDGTLTLVDKTTQTTYPNLGYFVDDEDAGDEYDYAPCHHPQQITSQGKPASIKLLHSGPYQITWQIEQTLSLPVALTADRRARQTEEVACPLTTRVTLQKGSRMVLMQTTVNNCAKDHRLRVCFPNQIKAIDVTADGHFEVITRPLDLPPAEATADWVQPPIPTHHQRYFVDISDGEHGLAIFNRGLPEYEILRDGNKNTIAVTLLRCVDAIFRDDLLTRPGYTGLTVLTPEAQCQGEHTFDYAIMPHQRHWETIYQPAYSYRTPFYVRRGDEQEGFIPDEAYPANHPQWQTFGPVTMKPLDLSGELPGELSFIQLEPASLILSAVKKAEREEALVVRFYNLSSESVAGRLTLFCPIKQAYEANLNEVLQSELSVAENQVQVSVRGKEIKTLILKTTQKA